MPEHTKLGEIWILTLLLQGSLVIIGMMSVGTTTISHLFSREYENMLNVYYGKMPDAIYNTAAYFSNVFQKTWLDDKYVRRMIKSVDRSEVIGDYLIKSKALGMIPPSQLSGGVKTLILTYFKPDMVFNASTCGDNCARWFIDMSKKSDRTINLRNIMDFGDEEFEIRILNNQQVVHSMKELVLVAGDFL